ENSFPEDDTCDYFSISRAMMSIGNYSQDYGGNWRRVGNHNDSTWRELFTISDRRKGFDETKAILRKYLQLLIDDTHAGNDSIVKNYLPETYPWRYYFTKYVSFRSWKSIPTEGYYYWDDYENKPYNCFMMYRRQFNGRHWNPFLLELADRYKETCRLGDYGDHLQITSKQITLTLKMNHDSFELCVADGDEHSKKALLDIINQGILNQKAKILIPKNNDGLDIEDRIKICSERLDQIQAYLRQRTR
ncbi:MAG TPA: hypothetical protein PK528_11175, partial [Syntrophorhabdus sp.]|nr:hypothetical protein [Syntrophorhabdus sp.]